MGWFQSSKRRVLVVDDEQAIGNITCDFLKGAGFEAVFTTNAVDALHQIQNKPVDAVLLDVFLEYEDGLAFLGKLKKRYPSIPVVILTGAGYDESMMETARQEGASGYVSKDTDLEDVVVAVQRVLR